MRRAIVVVLGLLLVLVGLDFAARAAAQAVVAQQVQTTEGLTQQPDVQVNGFPFLLQALRGRYDDVRVNLQGVPAGGTLRLDDVDARLTGVHVSLSTVMRRARDQVPVDAVQVTGTATYATLDAQANAAMPSGLGTVQFSDGGNGLVRVTVHVTELGVPLTLNGLAKISIARGKVTITVPQSALAQVPEMFRAAAAQLLTQTVSLPRLPLGLTATAVSVTAQGLAATAQARNVVLGTTSSR
jgi:LmeA-like phospholipid-binding